MKPLLHQGLALQASQRTERAGCIPYTESRHLPQTFQYPLAYLQLHLPQNLYVHTSCSSSTSLPSHDSPLSSSPNSTSIPESSSISVGSSSISSTLRRGSVPLPQKVSTMTSISTLPPSLPVKASCSVAAPRAMRSMSVANFKSCTVAAAPKSPIVISLCICSSAFFCCVMPDRKSVV